MVELDQVAELLARAKEEGRISDEQAWDIYRDMAQFVILTEWQEE